MIESTETGVRIICSKWHNFFNLQFTHGLIVQVPEELISKVFSRLKTLWLIYSQTKRDVFCFHCHSPNVIIIQMSLNSSKYTTLNSLGREIHPLSCTVCLLSLIRMNAAAWHLDQTVSIFASLSVHQVMTWASHVIGCGFILKWNLVSLLVEFLSRVFQLVPQLAVKPQQQYRRAFPRKATRGCKHSK